jgi:hypothetical protein
MSSVHLLPVPAERQDFASLRLHSGGPPCAGPTPQPAEATLTIDSASDNPGGVLRRKRARPRSEGRRGEGRSHRAASAEADELLFSLRSDDELARAAADLPADKILPDAMYFHNSAIPDLPPLLRVYAGCGGVLAGTVPANVIELHRLQRKISYLVLPRFRARPASGYSSVTQGRPANI